MIIVFEELPPIVREERSSFLCSRVSLPAVLRPDSSKSDPQKTPSANAGDSSGTTSNTNGISPKDLKGLSKCESNAAADGDLT